MNLLRSTEFRVGLLATAVLVLLAVMILNVSEDPSLHGKTRKLHFAIDDASGLIRNSPVKMAGIPVGIIKAIQLDNGQARVDMLVRRDLPITRASWVEIRNNGILGDRYLELVAGPAGAESLSNDAQIENVRNTGSLDQVMNRVSNVTQSLSEVANALREATTVGNTLTPLGRIMNNIEVITGDLKDFSQTNKNKIGQIVDNLNATTKTINDVVNDNSPDGFRSAWASAVASLKRVDRSMQNIEEVTDKINSGKGTIGRLINDDETINEIDTAVHNVNDMIGGVSRMQTSIDFHTEYLSSSQLYKSYFGLKIQPGLDRYYEVQVISDPKGVVERTKTDSTSNGASQPSTTETKTYQSRVKFTALFAKNFYDLSIKGGLIENTGGIGVDYYFLHRKLRLSSELFDVRLNDGVRLRSSLKYDFVHGLYIIGGVDDYLRAQNQETYIGAGLNIDNDDIKALLGKVSF